MEVAVPQGSTFPALTRNSSVPIPGSRSARSLTGDAAAALLDTLLPESQERPSRITVVRGYRRGTSFTATLVLHSADGPQCALPGLSRTPRPSSPRSSTMPAGGIPLRGVLVCAPSPPQGCMDSVPAPTSASCWDRPRTTVPCPPCGGSSTNRTARPGLLNCRRALALTWPDTTGPGRPATLQALHDSCSMPRSAGVNAACYLGPALAGIPVPGLVKVSRYGLVVTEWLPEHP